jgi:hypothetical protein
MSTFQDDALRRQRPPPDRGKALNLSAYDARYSTK